MSEFLEDIGPLNPSVTVLGPLILRNGFDILRSFIVSRTAASTKFAYRNLKEAGKSDFSSVWCATSGAWADSFY